MNTNVIEDYFTNEIKGAYFIVNKLEREILQYKIYAEREIASGVQDGRTDGFIRFKKYRRGGEKVVVGKFLGFQHQRGNSWMEVLMVRKDGTLGDHIHIIDPESLVGFTLLTVKNRKKKNRKRA